MKKFFAALLIMGLVLSLTTGLYANGLNLNGIGSKGSGMGTAFIGLADDFSAVFFNPAGLTQMKTPSLSVFITNLVPTGTYNFELMGATLADTQTESLMYPSGALAYFKPLSEKLVVGIAGYVPSGVGSKWPGDELAMLSGGTEFVWDSTIFMITVSPVAAYKINDKFSIGASLNINYVNLTMDRPGGGGSMMPYFQYSEKFSGFGLGATIGLMYKPMDMLSFGLTWKTPVKATIGGSAEVPAFFSGLPAKSDGERSATWPMWLGAGIAFKPTGKLTIVADVTYNNWKKMQSIPVTFDEPGWVMAGMEEASEFILKWENTWDFKVGMEYKLSDTLALRAGYYTDKSPSPEETLNIMLPSISYKAVTFGLGYTRGKIVVDLAFEFLTGSDRFVDPMNYLVGTGMPGTHGMKLIVPNITVTYVFGK